jgi:putative copper export protein
MNAVDVLPIALRTLTYVGSIAAAGGVLFAAGFPRATDAIRDDIDRQIAGGCCLLLVVEPMRYVAFQLSIAGGDWSLAFGPDLRWMGMQTPMGQAALTRLIAVAALLTFGLRSVFGGLAAALVMIASFAIEGHTASSEVRTVLGTGALFIHVTAVHWWLGALYPLLIMTHGSDPASLSDVVESFGRRAAWVVAGLLAGGVLVLAILTGAQVNPESTYQQRFLLKIALVAGLLAIAAWNKLRLTPLLRRDHEAGRAGLRASIKVELFVAVSVLLATAWIITSSPDS